MQKRLFLFVTFLCCMSIEPLLSQTEYRYVKGEDPDTVQSDTIPEVPPNWFIGGSWLEWAIEQNGTGHGYNLVDDYIMSRYHFNGIIARQCYTEDSSNIVGIAYVGDAWDCPGDPNNAFDEYLYLYDALPDTFLLLKQQPWHGDDPSTTVKVRRIGFNDECSREERNIYYSDYPLREYYFDTTYTVVDSFYVGYSQFGGFYSYPDDVNHWTIAGCIPDVVWNGYYSPLLDTNTLDPSCTFPYTLYKLYLRCVNPFQTNHFPTMTANEWRWLELPHFAYIFPLIGTNTTVADTFSCHNVADFQAEETDSNCVLLLWSIDSTHTSWEISYGPEGTTPESGQISATEETTLLLCNLDTCTRYVAYIRALCNHNDSIYYTEWSDSISIAFSCDTTSPSEPERIETLAELYTQIIPNPASDIVTIVSPYALKHIEIYDLKGHRIHSIETDGHSSELSVSSLASGTYIVAIHSDGGMITRKLVVSHNKQ